MGVAGSALHWRDVYSVVSWKKILEATAESCPKEGALAAGLTDLLIALVDYHSVEKPVLKNIPLRMEKLSKLADLASSLENTIVESGGVTSKTVPKGRSEPKVYQKSDIRGGSIIRQEKQVGPWVHSLARRAAKKVAYLEVVLDSEQSGPFASIGKMNEHIVGRMRTAPPEGLLRLTPGTKFEKMDFLHRDFEHHTGEDGSLTNPATEMSRALIEWLSSGSVEGFYVWLEGHPICTADRHFNGTSYKRVSSIQYGTNEKVRQVYAVGKRLMTRPFGSTDTLINLTTVRGTKAGEAFVWLVDGTLLVHAHQSGSFHHSSFNSGKKVRCAGTMEVEDGKLVGIDNNSGHYQPSDRHFLALLGELEKLGVMRGRTLVGTHGISDARISPYAPMWNLELAEYKDRAGKKGIKAFGVPESVSAALKHM